MIRSIRLGRAPNCSSLGNVVNVLAWSQVAVGALWAAAESWRARRARPEPGGGETRAVDEPPALVRTGEHNGAPHEAHVQLTRACPLPCPSCHVAPTARGESVPLHEIEARFRELSAEGVFHVAVGGGEALAHPEIDRVAEIAHAAGLSIGLTTSGRGLVDAAVGFDQVNVSLDGLGPVYERARGYDGAEDALRAIQRLAAGGVRVGVNIVLSRDTFPSLRSTVAAAVDAGARDVHLLRLKPSGRAVDDYLSRRLAAEQAMAVWPVLRELMGEFGGVTFRVDCAMTPWLAAHGVDADRMRAFGWTGCHGGDALVAIDVTGHRTPCSFVKVAPSPEWMSPRLPEPCASCAYRDICRGGCHAVALHLHGELLAPDPECPAVMAHG
ncbi:MAG: radical SAM protein [Deltaproteobacteria bacterium]|nr:radical SAM protein [Deltaproteobacteria bacterium]